MKKDTPPRAILVELKGLSKTFHTEDVETHALRDINLNIYQGEYLSITGPSGCGKSTLLSLLGLLDTASGGTYRLAGHDASGIDADERARIRNREIGFVFQSFNLISDLNVSENIELPLSYLTDLDKSQRRERVATALKQVNMDHRASHFPSQLSGGQQQRVAIARAIAGQPSLILADEPTGNLDTENAHSIMALLEELHANGTTICMVTHDPKSAARTERTVDLLDGEVRKDSALCRPHAVAS